MPARRILWVAIIASFAWPASASAQRERRRQIVEDLLKGLIESQLDPGHDDAHPRARPTVQPRRPAPEVVTAQIELEHLSGSLGQLVQVLQQESYASHAWRQPLADAMHLKAQCHALYQNSAFLRNLQPLIQSFTVIDQDWRGLSHQLNQSRSLGRQSRSLVDKVSEHEAEMCRILGLQPQLNRSELIRLTSTLNADYRNLIQDIGYEMRGDPQQSRWLAKGHALQARILQSTSLIDRGDYDSIVSAFKTCQTDWRTFAGQLRSVANDRIRNDLIRIEQTGREIHASLWLPVEIDRQYLVWLVGSVDRDVNQILDLVTLRDMLTCPQPARLLRVARELQGTSASFSQSIEGGQAIEDLIWDYRLFNVAWQELLSECRTLENPELQRRLITAADSMLVLEQTLGGGPAVGPAEILQMASQLDELCRQTALLINRRIAPASSYDRGMRQQIQTQAGGLHDSIRNLHRNLVNRQDDQIIRQDLNSAIVHWQQLKPLMNRCQDAEKQTFNQLRGQLEPLFVKMQIVYAD